MGKRDKQILFGIAAVAVIMMGIFYFQSGRGEGRFAQIWIDGEKVMELDLLKEEDRVLDLSSYGVEVELQIQEHKIGFLSSDCPDHLCIGFGMIDHEPQSAVCMPNRVVVTIQNTAS